MLDKRIKKLKIKENGIENTFPYAIKARFKTNEKIAVEKLKKIIDDLELNLIGIFPSIKQQPLKEISYYCYTNYFKIDLHKKGRHWELKASTNNLDSYTENQISVKLKNIISDRLEYA